MKLFFLLAASLAASAAELTEIKTVYLLPMSSGLDQFLASKLTSGAVLQVVTDPQKADAILADHVGVSLEQKLDELYGGAKPQKTDPVAAFTDSGQPRIQPMTRARGAIFLIDRKTRNVIWSDYERPKNTTQPEISHLADRIATRLAKEFKGK